MRLSRVSCQTVQTHSESTRTAPTAFVCGRLPPAPLELHVQLCLADGVGRPTRSPHGVSDSRQGTPSSTVLLASASHAVQHRRAYQCTNRGSHDHRQALALRACTLLPPIDRRAEREIRKCATSTSSSQIRAVGVVSSGKKFDRHPCWAEASFLETLSPKKAGRRPAAEFTFLCSLLCPGFCRSDT